METKMITTIDNPDKVSFVNKGLKSGKTYYYKVRAYEDNSGVKYGNYSAVKTAKAK